MLVFGNGGGLPLILFPTSFGRYYQNKDFGLVGSVSGYVDAGQVTVYCPDAIDLESFYNKSIHPADRMRTHNAYENVIVRARYSISPGTNAIVIAWRSAAQASGPITPPISLFVIRIPSVISSA